MKNRFKKLINHFSKSNEQVNKSKISSKTVVTANDTLYINSSVKSNAENITKTAKYIMKQYINNPDDLLKFIESKNTKVVRGKNLDKLLVLLGEYDSFVLPQNGLKAFLLILGINILSNKKMKFALKTPAMFVLNEKPVNVYNIAHQLHHWLAYIKGMPGYDEQTTRNFKNIWNDDFSVNDINNLSLQEVLALKDAIARDIEAIDFVKDLTKEYITSKISAEKLKNGQSQSI